MQEIEHHEIPEVEAPESPFLQPGQYSIFHWNIIPQLAKWVIKWETSEANYSSQYS